KQADAVALAPLPARAGADDDLAGTVAIDDHTFRAFEQIAALGLAGSRGDIVEVVARLLFGEAERKRQAAIDDAGDDARLHLLRAAEPHRAAAKHHGREIGLQRQRLAERLH